MGTIYSETGDTEKSVKVLTYLVYNTFEDVNNPFGEPRSFDGTKYYASEILGKIYEQKEMYDSVIRHLNLVDTFSHSLAFCGNGMQEEIANKALKYSYLYQKLGKKDSAVYVLLKSFYSLGLDNSKIVNGLKPLLKNRKGINRMFDTAISNVYFKPVNYGNKDYEEYCILFLNTEIRLPRIYKEDDFNYDTAKALENLYQTKFYKMVRDLN
jgi:hypothetical protein